MNDINRWVARYGPQDGAWLQAELARLMADEKGVCNARVARMDDAAEMAQYAAREAEAEEPGQGEAGDWELLSPHSGIRYKMGCNW
jgi:hypothetical protein